jgi:hypothetical protein
MASLTTLKTPHRAGAAGLGRQHQLGRADARHRPRDLYGKMRKYQLRKDGEPGQGEPAQ